MNKILTWRFREIPRLNPLMLAAVSIVLQLLQNRKRKVGIYTASFLLNLFLYLFLFSITNMSYPQQVPQQQFYPPPPAPQPQGYGYQQQPYGGQQSYSVQPQQGGYYPPQQPNGYSYQPQ